jgi:hypothetical protein
VLLQITPDYTEYFYDELRPNVHYIPASLDNITEVARYIVDKANESEMKNVVKAARSWNGTTSFLFTPFVILLNVTDLEIPNVL